MKVHTVDFCSLQDTDVLEIGGLAHDRFHHVVKHGVVALNLFFARPASHQLRLFVQGGIGNVRDVRQPLERNPGRLLVPEIDRQKLDVAAAR